MLFAKKKKQKPKNIPKRVAKEAHFHPNLFIFLHKPKRMLKFLQNGSRNGMVQEIVEKKVSLSIKMQFSVSNHVTLGVVR